MSNNAHWPERDVLRCVKESKTRINPSVNKDESYLPTGLVAHEVRECNLDMACGLQRGG